MIVALSRVGLSEFRLLELNYKFPVPDLGVFAKLRKARTSFVLSVCSSAWKRSALTGRILKKLDI